jgi:hypothetical protein
MAREEGGVTHGELWEAVIGPAIAHALGPFEDLKRPAPEELLHFTSAAGFVSILKNRFLRLSRARASNDPLELHYGLDLSRRILGDLCREDVDKVFRETISLAFDGLLLDGTDEPLPDPHVCCFTTADREREIAHWALYGRSGAGVALVFDGIGLSRLKSADLVPVVYDFDAQMKLLGDALVVGRTTAQAAYAFGRKSSEREARRCCLIASHTFGTAAFVLAAAMKRPMFQFEREWRLLTGWRPAGLPSLEGVRFDVEVVGPVLRSYFEIPFPAQALKSVVIGASHADLNEPVAKALLKELGYEAVDVRRGDVSLRSFTT